MENYTKRDGDSALSDNCRQPPFKKPMNNNPAGNHLLACCAGSAISALLAFSSPVAKAGIHLHGEIRVPAAGQAVFLYDPSGFPSGDIPHADGPFTPIPLQAHPFTSSGTSTAAAMFLHGTPGRITTALSGRRASAADIMPHALRHARPLSGPTAPGAHMKGPLPVSIAGKTHPHPPQSKRPAQSFLFIPGKKGRTSLPPAA